MKVANYAIIVGKVAINFGVKQGLLTPGFNPFAGIEFYKVESRERFLSEAELVRIGMALAALEGKAMVSPLGCHGTSAFDLYWCPLGRNSEVRMVRG